MWHMLIQYLLGLTSPGYQLSHSQSSSFFQLSNPLLYGGTPLGVRYHQIDNPIQYESSEPKNSATSLINSPTHLFTTSASLIPPVCILEENEQEEIIAPLVPYCLGDSESSFVQFTPMKGRIGSIKFDGVGFISTDDGVHLFFYRPHSKAIRFSTCRTLSQTKE